MQHGAAIGALSRLQAAGRAEPESAASAGDSEKGVLEAMELNRSLCSLSFCLYV